MGEKGRKEQKSNQIKSYALIESRKQSLSHSICAFSCPSYPRYLTFYTHYLAHRANKKRGYSKKDFILIQKNMVYVYLISLSSARRWWEPAAGKSPTLRRRPPKQRRLSIVWWCPLPITIQHRSISLPGKGRLLLPKMSALMLHLFPMTLFLHSGFCFIP